MIPCATQSGDSQRPRPPRTASPEPLCPLFAGPHRVMAGTRVPASAGPGTSLVRAIDIFEPCAAKGVDGRDEPGHDN
jgi:hypothetical protein